MRKITLLSVLMFGSLITAKAGDEKTTVKSEIKEVTVFINGAQVSRTATTYVPVGQSYFVFEGLSQYINANSIRVKGTGDFTILSVSHQLNYMNTKEKPKEISALGDSLELYESQLEYLKSMLDVYVAEKTMITANQSIGGETNGVKIEDLKAAAEYFRSRLADINVRYIETNGKIDKLQEKISKVTNQLSTLNAKQNIPTSEITVAVSSKAKISATFELTYAVTGANWTPSYDLRAIDAGSPITLNYRADVYQSTGEDWKNVKLKLSAGNPAKSGAKPNPQPWYLYIYNNYNYDYRSSVSDKVTMLSEKSKGEKEEDDYGQAPAYSQTAADYTSVNENTTNFEFEISLPYTINSDGKTTVVEIQNYSMPATYEYYCAAKLDPTAFLLAKVTGWEDYNLLSGSVNLYFEGTYVGKSYLNVKDTKDTIDFSLGRDENIVIERKKQKDYNANQFIGSNRKVSFAWEISVRNKKKTPITIVVEDQVPLTTDKQIEIEKGTVKDAAFDETTGILKWKLNITSAETKKLNFSYTVKYPKDKNVYVE